MYATLPRRELRGEIFVTQRADTGVCPYPNHALVGVTPRGDPESSALA